MDLCQPYESHLLPLIGRALHFEGTCLGWYVERYVLPRSAPLPVSLRDFYIFIPGSFKCFEVDDIFQG